MKKRLRQLTIVEEQMSQAGASTSNIKKRVLAYKEQIHKKEHSQLKAWLNLAAASTSLLGASKAIITPLKFAYKTAKTSTFFNALSHQVSSTAITDAATACLDLTTLLVFMTFDSESPETAAAIQAGTAARAYKLARVLQKTTADLLS